MTISILRDVPALRGVVGGWRAAGLRVALVPTMGALHAGHLALVARARELADRVVASVFVNPTQFAPTEDFSRYPRDESGDAAMLASAGCEVMYAPSAAVMYPQGFCTAMQPAGPALGLEAEHRPQMFAGVALVCTKLFLQCAPDVAVFGEKDWQQVQVIRRVVADLDLPLAIEAVPTVREADGLAMSSRNRFLDARSRAVAPALVRILREVAAGGAIDQAVPALLAAGFDAVDYVAVRDGVVLGAARIGGVRLIDNVAMAR